MSGGGGLERLWRVGGNMEIVWLGDWRRCKMQNAKCEMQNVASFELRVAGCGMGVAELGLAPIDDR